jgi:hypothetical protein
MNPDHATACSYRTTPRGVFCRLPDPARETNAGSRHRHELNCMSQILHPVRVTALHRFVPIASQHSHASCDNWPRRHPIGSLQPRWSGLCRRSGSYRASQRPNVAGPGVRSTEAIRFRSIARAHASSKMGQRASNSRWRANLMLAGLLAIALTGCRPGIGSGVCGVGSVSVIGQASHGRGRRSATTAAVTVIHQPSMS